MSDDEEVAITIPPRYLFFQMCHQNSMRFLHNTAYDEYYGAVSNDENAECDRIAQALGEKVRTPNGLT